MQWLKAPPSTLLSCLGPWADMNGPLLHAPCKGGGGLSCKGIPQAGQASGGFRDLFPLRQREGFL